MCCYDGAYLAPGEEPRIRRLLHVERAWFGFIEGKALVRGEGGAIKTAVRPHRYRQELPPHWTSTRCVFALPDARCSLQVLAVERGHAPWTWKPRVCWLHPLRENASSLLAPPARPEEDWDRADGYPGFTTSTRCGAPDPEGTPWEELLADEIAWWSEGRSAEGGENPGA